MVVESWSLSPDRTHAADDDQRIAAELQMQELRSQQQLEADAHLAAEIQAHEQQDWNAQPIVRHNVSETTDAVPLCVELMWRCMVEGFLSIMLLVFLSCTMMDALQCMLGAVKPTSCTMLRSVWARGGSECLPGSTCCELCLFRFPVSCLSFLV